MRCLRSSETWWKRCLLGRWWIWWRCRWWIVMNWVCSLPKADFIWWAVTMRICYSTISGPSRKDITMFCTVVLFYDHIYDRVWSFMDNLVFPSLKLTVRTWKWISWKTFSFPFGFRPMFRRSVRFREFVVCVSSVWSFSVFFPWQVRCNNNFTTSLGSENDSVIVSCDSDWDKNKTTRKRIWLAGKNHHFGIGGASSTCCLSIVMLVFQDVLHPTGSTGNAAGFELKLIQNTWVKE